RATHDHDDLAARVDALIAVDAVLGRIEAITDEYHGRVHIDDALPLRGPDQDVLIGGPGVDRAFAIGPGHGGRSDQALLDQPHRLAPAVAAGRPQADRLELAGHIDGRQVEAARARLTTLQ